MVDLENFFHSIPYIQQFIKALHENIKQLKEWEKIGERCGLAMDVVRKCYESSCHRLERMEAMERAAVRIIELLPDETDRTIMKARYLDGLKWEDIAELTHYGENRPYQRRRKALETLRTVYGHEVHEILAGIEEPPAVQEKESDDDATRGPP